MLPCPACHNRLGRIRTPHGYTYSCADCGGMSVPVPVLRKDSTKDFVKGLLVSVRQSDSVSTRRCPFCGRAMRICRLSTPGGPLELDYCQLCNQVWFDPKEYQSVPSAPPPSHDEELSPRAREALALYKIESQKENVLPIDQEGPDENWQYIPAILGLPVEYNDTPLARKPWMTWGLSAAMAVLCAALAASDSLRGAIDEFGFIPEQWYRHGCLTLLTSFFLHAGILHVASNLYFFMVFGDNVEDHLGGGKFVLLLLACHLAGLLVHAAGDPRGNVPLVGASAGIAGVLAYYAVTFPHAKLGFLWRYWCYFRWFRISAVWALVLFVGLQLLGAWQQSLGLTSVSSFGHLGGLTVGLIAGLWGRMTSKPPRNESQSVGPAD